jgi:divalent metal cation (Fe/Co/Zn/Cd) transporter
VEQAPFELPVATIPAATDRAPLVRRARFLAALGLGWHLVEAAIALLAGLAAGSIALVGFGADSVVEGAAGVVVLWRFSARREASEAAERRAQRLIGASFFAIAIYVGVEAVRTLVAGDHPESSWVGIGLALVTLATMPPLAAAKARVGEKLTPPQPAARAGRTCSVPTFQRPCSSGWSRMLPSAGRGRTRPRPW